MDVQKPLILSFSCLILAIGVVHSEVLSQNSQIMDASDVKWAHAVNNLIDLEKNLTGAVDFLEADISMGHVTGNLIGPPIPIMAHPPLVESDISFETWLDIVITRTTGKGAKLDFKSANAVESSLKVLKNHEKKINFPLWLNADILSGPVDSLTLPVNATLFLKSCKSDFPDATLSVGWTTTWFPVMLPNTWRYAWNHVKEMADTLICSGIELDGKTKLTFPVRAIFASRSISQLLWLLEIFSSSTLTVWSAKSDAINLTDLLKIRKSFNISQVYYDIPEPLNTEFQIAKNTVANDTVNNGAANKWWTMQREKSDPASCFPGIYVTKNSLFFSKGQESAALFKDTFDISQGSYFEAKGILHFIKSAKPSLPSVANNKLVLALADVSLFKKDEMPFTDNADDTAIVWQTLNSSRLYEFEQRDITYSTAYFFKLDTSKEDDMFQVWKLTWPLLLDDLLDEEQMIKKGTPLIDKNNKLVLPSGPIMLGFSSDGAEDVIVYNLNIQGVVTSHPRASVASESLQTLSFASILFFVIFILLS